MLSAEVDGDTVTLTFDLPIKTTRGWGPAWHESFETKINGTSVSASDVTHHRRSLTFTVSEAAMAGDTVKVSYTNMSSSNPIRYATSGLGSSMVSQRVPDFSDLVATNNTN